MDRLVVLSLFQSVGNVFWSDYHSWASLSQSRSIAICYCLYEVLSVDLYLPVVLLSALVVFAKDDHIYTLKDLSDPLLEIVLFFPVKSHVPVHLDLMVDDRWLSPPVDHVCLDDVLEGPVVEILETQDSAFQVVAPLPVQVLVHPRHRVLLLFATARHDSSV